MERWTRGNKMKSSSDKYKRLHQERIIKSTNRISDNRLDVNIAEQALSLDGSLTQHKPAM